MEENVHKGHRQRVRNEFLEKGFDEKTPPHKILELLLFYSIPQKDTNEIAHNLINEFKTLSGVLNAPTEELVKIDGITENTAVLFKLITPIMRICNNEKYNNDTRFKNLDEIGSFLLCKYFGYVMEVFSLICIDGKGKLISFDILDTGDISSVGVSTRRIIELVLKSNASCSVIAHNHPGGIALPSGADISITEMVSKALLHIGVKLIDHIIIADDDYVSMAQSKKYEYLFSPSEA